MGGLNQNTQLWRSGCEFAEALPLVPDPEAPAFGSASTEFDGFPAAGLLRPPSLADFSAVGVLAAAPRACSNGFPGVLGVLAEPKEANAPDPSPNAVDALGDTSPPGVVIELKGLFPPCEELSPPNRLAKELRPEGEESFWALLPGVDSESLLGLRGEICVSSLDYKPLSIENVPEGAEHTCCGDSIVHPWRRRDAAS